MTTTKKKIRQHYVPQFYLRQFSSEKKGEYYIWCYNKKTSNVFKSNIINIGMEKYFYHKNDIFENLLSILEGQYSEIYRIIRKKPISTLTEKEKQLFVELVQMQDTRTRKARDNMIEVNEEVITSNDFQDWFQEILPDITIEEYLEDIKRNIQLSEMFNIEIKDNKPRFSETLDIIMEFDMFLLFNDIHMTKAKFYTSDHPICHYSLSEEKDMKIIFPLTPELCLMFTNDKGWETMYPSHNACINKRFVQMVNERMVEKSYRFIFSKTNDFEFVKRVLNTRNE